jgi:hypothetical protein
LIYDGAAWTDMDVEDLETELECGRSIEEAAQFLCRRQCRRDPTQGEGTRDQGESKRRPEDALMTLIANCNVVSTDNRIRVPKCIEVTTFADSYDIS